ncbi:MAG: DUF2202 domain-containing protein, partial [Verrucomicrobiales bacterium]|nr:DUF2202 domain-containing protein [Verrucomicrobiales bacterium]
RNSNAMKRILSTLLLTAVCGLGPTASALTPTDAENILFIKQEEKLARDVYQFLYATWGHVTFQNIALSEQRHMDAVDGLIARYRLEDKTPAELGKFTIPELQALYDQLVVAGSQSLAEALAVGVLIEETDIADLQEMLKTTRETPIRRVLTNLLNGSRNHLSAFSNALAQLTATTATPTVSAGGGGPQAPAPGRSGRR